MESLLQIFNEDEVVELIELNPEIRNVSDDNINKLINILKNYKFSVSRLKNIIKSNPFYLSRDIDEVDALINKLLEKEIYNVGIIIDTYPLFLNYYDEDIDEFFDLKSNEELNNDEIVELIESNPYLIDEI